MADLPDAMKALGLSAEFLATRPVRFLPEADRAVLPTVRCGVLFVMAWWSGPARQAFAALRQVLTEVDPQGRLELVVVDTDGCPDLYEAPEFRGKLSGAGETFWISEGRVVREAAYGTREVFAPNTEALLALCAGRPRTAEETA